MNRKKINNALLNLRRKTTLYWTTEEAQRYTEPRKKHNVISYRIMDTSYIEPQKKHNAILRSTEETPHHTEQQTKNISIIHQRRNATLYWTAEETQHFAEPVNKHNSVLSRKTKMQHNVGPLKMADNAL